MGQQIVGNEMGGKPIGDRAMTSTERSRKWRARHRMRLPWAEDVAFNPEIAAWEMEALAPKKTAKVVPLRPRKA
jgi:hypothetical protein